MSTGFTVQPSASVAAGADRDFTTLDGWFQAIGSGVETFLGIEIAKQAQPVFQPRAYQTSVPSAWPAPATVQPTVTESGATVLPQVTQPQLDWRWVAAGGVALVTMVVLILLVKR